MSQSFEVVTCMGTRPTAPYYCYDQWKKSLDRHGITPTILGQPPYAWKWGGLISKAKWLKRAIDEKITTASVIIFADCFDLVYAAHPQEIIEAFEIMRVPIAFGAERNFFVAHNNIQMAALHPPSPSSFKYINTGFLVGYADAISDALDEIDVEKFRDDYRLPGGGNVENNDQNLWCRQLLFGSMRMGLDHTAALILNCHGVGLDEVEFINGGRVRVNETGAMPVAIHFNGDKNSPIKEALFRHMGL